MAKRPQPAWLAERAARKKAEREQRTPELLQLRAVLALERIADAFERFPDRFAIFLQRSPVPIVRKGPHDAT